MGKVRWFQTADFFQFLTGLAGPVHSTGLASSVASEPPAGSLAPGQFKLWLDASAPGAWKIIAKDANGTVVRGTVSLG